LSWRKGGTLQYFTPQGHFSTHTTTDVSTDIPSPLGTAQFHWLAEFRQGAKAPCHHGAWQLLPIAVPAPRRALVLGDSKSLMQILKDIPP